MKRPQLIGTNLEFLTILVSHIVDFLPYLSDAQLISLMANLDHEFAHRNIIDSTDIVKEAEDAVKELMSRPIEGSMLECSTGDLLEALDTHYGVLDQKPLGVVMCGCGERPKEERDKPFYTILVRCQFLRCPDCQLLLFEKEQKE